MYGSVFINFPLFAKIAIISTAQVTSFLIIAYSCRHEDNPAYFYVALVASGLTGFAQGFGEATFLGFLREFPSHLVGYVSSGTGLAGICGTLMLILLN